MNEHAADHDRDQADNDMFTPTVSDDALEAAADPIAGSIPTGSINLIPPNCC
jgi:hypothetical protein